MKGTSHEAHSNGRRTEKSPITVSSSEKILTKTKYIKNDKDRENYLKKNKLIDLKVMHYYIINVFCTSFQMPRWPQFNGTWISVQFLCPFVLRLALITTGFLMDLCFPIVTCFCHLWPQKEQLSHLFFLDVFIAWLRWGGCHEGRVRELRVCEGVRVGVRPTVTLTTTARTSTGTFVTQPFRHGTWRKKMISRMK